MTILEGKKVLLCGAAYKDEVDDTRNSPSLKFYKELKKFNTKITVHDPLVKYWKEAKIILTKKIPNFKLFDIIIFATKHRIYQSINFKKIYNKQVFFDLNNVLNQAQIKKIKYLNLKLFLIGKGFL